MDKYNPLGKYTFEVIVDVTILEGKAGEGGYDILDINVEVTDVDTNVE